jgi:dTDP-4-dehydrorhamnose reductase
MSRQTDPTIGIVGANGQVGTELCFILRERGIRVVPVVRNSVGAATFDHYGFDVRIADVGELSDAEDALSDLDAVIVAAFASPTSRGEFTPKGSRRTNERLARNSVRAAADDATVIYFSSVAAFGEEIGVSERWWYVREKTHIENAFNEECELRDRSGYVHRIGLVLGQNIDRTRRIESRVNTSDRVDVETSANSPSNTVHTVTIADSALACVRSSVPNGTYTVVNRPQWTWHQVFERYRSSDTETELRFVGPRDIDERSLADRLASIAGAYITDHTTELMSIGYLLPDTINQFVFNRYMQNEVSGQISEYEGRFGFQLREFEYAEAPGPAVPGTKATDTRLDEWSYPPPMFE